MKQVKFDWIDWFLVFVIMAFSFFLIATSSCSKTLYVPIESVRTEYKDVLLRDSVYVSDSVVIRAKNDTIWYEKYRIRYQDRLLRDSIIVTDSVQVPYPVEKQLSKWETVKMELGGWAIGVIIVCALAITRWLVYRMRRK